MNITQLNLNGESIRTRGGGSIGGISRWYACRCYPQ